MTIIINLCKMAYKKVPGLLITMIISSSDDSEDELDSSQIFFEDGAEVAPLAPSHDSSLSESLEDSGFVRF
jgi:hypothetical protein